MGGLGNLLKNMEKLRHLSVASMCVYAKKKPLEVEEWMHAPMIRVFDCPLIPPL